MVAVSVMILAYGILWERSPTSVACTGGFSNCSPRSSFARQRPWKFDNP
jgi:hypothetical protein